MKRTGEIIVYNANVSPALNAFGQTAVQTGLSVSGNEALLMLGAQLEASGALGTLAIREIALSRASKLAMPSILDDDVMIKVVTASVLVTSGYAIQSLTEYVPLPPNAIIVVEANFYLQQKYTSAGIANNTTALVWFEKVVLTDAEKNAILSSRLNNLLN